MQQVLGVRTRTEVRSQPHGLFGLKTRDVEVTAYRWTVDGSDLAEWVGRHRRADDPVIPAEESIWLAGDADDARERLRRLLGQGPSDFGQRTALLVCPVCGDLACGAFTAEVAIEGSVVTWRSMGYNDGTQETPPFLFEPCLELQFDRKQYSEVLLSLLDVVDQPAP